MGVADEHRHAVISWLTRDVQSMEANDMAYFNPQNCRHYLAIGSLIILSYLVPACVIIVESPITMYVLKALGANVYKTK